MSAMNSAPKPQRKLWRSWRSTGNGFLGKMIEQASAASAMAQHGSAIRALELIGKEFGMFVERRDSLTLYANLSDDELAASLQRYIRRDDADAAARLPEASH